MSSEKLPRYYVSAPNDNGYANIGDRECTVYGEPFDHDAVIMVCGHMRDGINTAHRYATELAAKLNGAAEVVDTASTTTTAPTLRQLYKAAALKGLLGNSNYTAGPVGFPTDIFARDAGKIADAMLAEDEEHAKK